MSVTEEQERWNSERNRGAREMEEGERQRSESDSAVRETEE